MSSLPPKRQRFVTEYLVDLNATQAALRAGYSERTAKAQGSRLLTFVDVQAAIEQARGARDSRTGVNADRVVRELARIAFGDVKALFDETGRLRPIHELEADVSAMLSGVEVAREKTRTRGDETEETTVEESIVKVKSWDKVRALELLAKHLGMLKDRTVLENPDGTALNISVYIPSNGRDTHA